MDLVIQNGTIVTTDTTWRADIGITDEQITAIKKKLKPGSETQVVDAKGMYVFPGAIDAHVHFQLPIGGTISADDFENGTKAAAMGGVTTVIDFATQEKGGTIQEAVEARRKEADDKVCIDYGLHAGITDWNDETQSEIQLIIKSGIPSFKMFMIYRERGLMADDGMLFQGLEETKKHGGMISVHAESASILDMLIKRYANEMGRLGAYAHALSRPDFTESEAVQRVIKWAEATGGRLYIVHMSAGESAQYVHDARARGVDVYAETCPQYLLLDDSIFKQKNGHYYATCPQVKKKTDNERLWQGLETGDIQVIATDTCTLNTQQKDTWGGDFRKIPYGLPGVETMLPLMYTEGVGKQRFSVNHLIALISTNPAKIFGMYPQKGTIALGSDADIVVFDPNKKVILHAHDLQTNCDWSPYENWSLKGYPNTTISRGKIIVSGGEFIGECGHGQFLKRKPIHHLGL
ncbi:MAG: dihydropyrimidinase [Promethearchaeota archaeon]